MKLILVRHGHPDYKNDCLTELGHEQAEKAAVRLIEERIDEIYSSTCGRAYETALHTSKRLSLPVTQLEFMREIKWGSPTGEEIYERGHPWHLADHGVSLGRSLWECTWAKTPPYGENVVFNAAESVARNADLWLKELGYEREGDYYRVTTDNTEKSIALFSHGGSSSALIAHLFNLPFLYICKTVRPDFTAITVIELIGKTGELIMPELKLVNDARHIKTADATFQM